MPEPFERLALAGIQPAQQWGMVFCTCARCFLRALFYILEAVGHTLAKIFDPFCSVCLGSALVIIMGGTELANIGSIQSRLGTALSNLQQTRENYNAAESRIVDVDVAEESASLVKRQILQDAASAILAQANQEPGLLLRLLKP